MASTLYDDLLSQNPVLRELNISPQWLQNALAESASPRELYDRITQLPQYKQRFQGARRIDGTVRWTEAEHIRRENDIRGLMRQYGVDPREYSTPASMIGFHESEQSLDEIRDRFEIWDYVKTGGQTIKETFYAYAGLKITDDDLFESVVDGAREQQLFTQYNANRAAMAFDYAGWITRATQVANQRVATELQRLQKTGALTGQAVQRVLSVDPAFGRQIMDVLYNNGGEGGGIAGSVNLQQLLFAYESAAIGAAAREAGLELPTKERLQEIKAAGVQREAAMKAYSEYGRDQNRLAAAVQRARGVGFSQGQFEAAEFLGSAQESRNLAAGVSYMAGAGRSQGGFRFTENQGRITQLGFNSYAA